MKLNFLLSLAILILFSCGGGKGDTSDPTPTPKTTPKDLPVDIATSVKVNLEKTKVTGDFTLSTVLAVEGGKLVFTIPAIADPADPSKPVDPASVVFNITGKDSKPLTCTVSADSTVTKPKVDLVFVTDTTGSMSSTLTGVTNSIQKFVDSVAAEGVDMKLGLVAYGDAFATKSASSTFKGTGPLGTPPSFDSSDRPFLDLTDVASFKALNSSLYATGGGDSEENTLGATQFAFKNVTWREGAAKVMFVTGDNSAQVVGNSTTSGVWNPPAAADLISLMKGNATVHTIGPDYVGSDGYDFSALATALSGKKFPLTDPDLVSVKFADWFTKSMKGTCDGIEVGTYDIVLVVKIKGVSKTYTATVTLGVVAG